MNKNFALFGLLAAVALILSAPEAFASDGAAAGDASVFGLIGLGAVVGLGIAAAGGGIGLGLTANGALTAMSRNPGFYQRLFTNMIIGMALIEGAILYVFVLALIFMYATPWGLAG